VRADNNHENAVLCSLRQKEMEDVAREMLEQLRLNKKPDFAKSFKKINISFEESGGKRTKAYREYLEERPNNA
jgi:Tfp pilus assembly protein PilF